MRFFVTEGRSPIWHASADCPYVLKSTPGGLGARSIGPAAVQSRRPCKWCVRNVSTVPASESIPQAVSA